MMKIAFMAFLVENYQFSTLIHSIHDNKVSNLDITKCII